MLQPSDQGHQLIEHAHRHRAQRGRGPRRHAVGGSGRSGGRDSVASPRTLVGQAMGYGTGLGIDAGDTDSARRDLEAQPGLLRGERHRQDRRDEEDEGETHRGIPNGPSCSAEADAVGQPR